MGLRIAIDTGGTFTDVVAIDEATGDITAVKTPSTPIRPQRRPARRRRKILTSRRRPPEDVRMLLHGSTVATNAVLEHKFDGLGLLVTKGFRHLIEIARQSVPDGYGNSFFWVKPRRLVPLHLVREVPGRMRFDGSEIEPLDEAAAIDAVVRELVEDGVRCIGVCLLHSYANDAHEKRDRRADRPAFPRPLRLAVVGRAAGISRIRARDDDAHRRAGQALLQDLPADARPTRSATRRRHPLPDHAVERRHREALDRRRAAGDHAAVRTGGRRARLDPYRPARRLSQHPDHRRRRHLDRRRRSSRTTSRCTPRPRWSRAIRSRRRCSTSSPSAPAAARSSGPTLTANSRSARRALAPTLARSATARAAPSRP